MVSLSLSNNILYSKFCPINHLVKQGQQKRRYCQDLQFLTKTSLLGDLCKETGVARWYLQVLVIQISRAKSVDFPFRSETEPEKYLAKPTSRPLRRFQVDPVHSSDVNRYCSGSKDGSWFLPLIPDGSWFLTKWNSLGSGIHLEFPCFRPRSNTRLRGFLSAAKRPQRGVPNVSVTRRENEMFPLSECLGIYWNSYLQAVYVTL